MLMHAGLLTYAHAQFQLPESKYLSQLKMKTLAVPLMEPDTRTMINLQSKPEQLEQYKAGIAAYNEMLQAAASHYTLGRGVEFMPASKVSQLIKEGNSKYVVLQYELREGQISQPKIGSIYGSGPYTTEKRETARQEGFGVYRLLMPARNQDATVLYSVFLPVAYPSTLDMVYAFRMMDNELNKAMKEKSYQVSEFLPAVMQNNKELAKKTLLIDEKQLDSRTSADDLLKVYPHKLEVSSFSRIEEAAKQGDSAYAYVMIVPMEDVNNKVTRSGITTRLMHLIIDAASGQVLGTAKPTRLNYDKIAQDISKREAKEYFTGK